jgi:hypothetical protein
MPWASRAFGTNRSGPCVSCPRPAVLNGWCFGDREGCAGLATRADLGPSLAQRLPGFSLMETRIAEPQRRGVARWHGDKDARRAVYNNRTRLRSEVGKQAMRNRAELVERSAMHPAAVSVPPGDPGRHTEPRWSGTPKLSGRRLSSADQPGSTLVTK